jgi:hypothetical protein
MLDIGVLQLFRPITPGRGGMAAIGGIYHSTNKDNNVAIGILATDRWDELSNSRTDENK